MKAAPKKKKDAPETLAEARIKSARVQGCLSGMGDHIASLQRELIDIEGRCALVLELGVTLPAITEKHKEKVREIAGFCCERFTALTDYRDQIAAILKEI